MSRLKIALLLDDGLDVTDGVQQYVLALGGWLTAQGHEVSYVVGETSRADIPRLYSLARNVRVRFNGNRLSVPLPVRKRAIARLLGEHSFDVVHVQVPYSPLFAGRVLRRLPSTTAVVGTFHVLPFGRPERWANRLLAVVNRRTARRFDTMISSTEPTAVFAREVYGFDSLVIPHPIRVADFTVKPIRNAVPTIVFLGRLVDRKGPLELLEAVRLLRERQLYDSPFRVLIGGKGPLLERLQQFTVEYGLQDVVSFAGFVAEDAKAQFLAGADIAVFPSLSGESFGISLLEALAAAGGVVLGGNNPGYRAVLSPLGRDRLVEPADTAAFAEQLGYWLQHPDARGRAAVAQKRYVERFDIHTIGADVAGIYAEALRQRRNVP